MQHKLPKLFLSTLSISAFTFGGGFVIVTLMKRKFVDELHWVSEEEMLDMTALAQSSPGAIAVNAAILMGWRVGGFIGMLTALIGTILPPLVIISIVSAMYAAFSQNLYIALLLKGMQAGVTAVILDVAWSLARGVLKAHRLLPITLMVIAFALVLMTDLNVVIIILGAALIGVLYALIASRRDTSGGTSHTAG